MAAVENPVTERDAGRDFEAPLCPMVASIEEHTMGESLFEYLNMKVHPDIKDHDWTTIKVKGCHSRAHASRISAIEKRGKLFNWQRPTTSHAGSGVLELQCFPGLDYVEHYAGIVATYLALNRKSPKVVNFSLPTRLEQMKPLLESNLRELGDVDVAILGYVQGLERFTSGTWTMDDANELFAWKILTMPNGCRVAFIGCRVSFWGDIAGNVVRSLQILNKVKCTLYIGKLGSLRPEHKPNTLLATGNQSFVNGTMVTWTNVLEHAITKSAFVQLGVHYTLPSVLQETKSWLAEREGSFDWVDPEIGHMAQASLEGQTSFGYLHVVSDNIAQKYPHDLSNERLEQVLNNRARLIAEIEDVVELYLSRWNLVT